jgi:hypothetical protein
MQHVHIEDDYKAMELTCWAAFISPEQEAPLLEMLDARERPDNLAFEREFGLVVPEDNYFEAFREGSEWHEG